MLLLITILALLCTVGLHGIAEMNAPAESAAFRALRQMQFSLSAAGPEHLRQRYPDNLPPMSISPYAQKYYRFQYISRRSANGEIVGYVIQATPVRCECAFPMSFTITDDGRVFWTSEPRAATVSDTYYNE
jgi:hypothetical protein